MTDLAYIPARLAWPRPSVCWPPCLGVVHDMEAPEGPLTAEHCARYFEGPKATGSAHVCVDENSAVRCVLDTEKAAGARGAPYRSRTINDWALQVEHAGYARQSRAEWLDASSTRTMEQGARVFAGWCDLYTIPPYRLTDDELRAGMHGIVGHGDVSRALRVPQGHTDPGSGFPWDVYLEMVRSFMAGEIWTPDEKRRLLAGADAAVAIDARWDQSARDKVDVIYAETHDEDHPEVTPIGTLGGRVKAIVAKLP